MDTIAIILAAGQGTRMKSQTPKVLHKLMGKPLVRYSVDMSIEVTGNKPIVVIGHGAELLVKELGSETNFVTQEQQLGTGHAVLQTEQALAGFAGQIVMISADMPLLRKETIAGLIQKQKENPGSLTLLTVTGEESRGFGRIIRDSHGNVTGIVEEAQATKEQLTIKEYNVGAYCVDAKWLWTALKKIQKSPKGEYYLTDIVQIAVDAGMDILASEVASPSEALGINTRQHLAEAETALRQRINVEWMLNGVTMVDPTQVYIEPAVKIQPDTTIWPGTYLKGKTDIGSGCVLGPNTIIESSQVGNDCRILSSVIEFAICAREHILQRTYIWVTLAR
jgi:bifunctional UDP-N-acetylglucosamine pyrophosphorylase / glucosamine-1-phosphate N-acetyltransferase